MSKESKLSKRPFVVNKDFNSIFCLSKGDYYLNIVKFKTLSYVIILIILSWLASTSIVSDNPRDLPINIIMCFTSLCGFLLIYFSIEFTKMMKKFISDSNSRSTTSLVCRNLPEELLSQCVRIDDIRLRRRLDKDRADRFLYKLIFGMDSTNVLYFIYMKRFISLDEIEAFISRVKDIADENGIEDEIKLTYIAREDNIGYSLVTVE